MKKTSIALGSGGARGLAHIGILRALEERGEFDIEAITGSSIGSLIGGLYAANKLDEYADWVQGLSLTDIWKLLDFSYAGVGLFKGDRLMEKLSDLVGDTRIEDLPIPFSAVATDVRKREEVWISQGSMFDAIRASIAIPGFFTPVERDGRILVDGGLLSPLPLTPIQHNETDYTVVVSLNGKPGSEHYKALEENTEPTAKDEASGTFGHWVQKARDTLGVGDDDRDSDSVVDLIAQSVEAMQDRIGRYQLAAFEPDLLIEVPVDACGILDFHRGTEMIDLGYELTMKALKKQP